MLLDKVVTKEERRKYTKMSDKICFGYFELPMLVIVFKVALLLPVGTEEPKDQRNRDLPRTVGLALPSAVGGTRKGVQALIQDFDLRLGCLELEKEEESRATN
ncbi:hypothetical protein M9H77_30507 [Catharanthus roseus]|uniref:Uncharacterized protein n=1 Tax=Catharanthus roseus TaxID=4058 RepID=A0ACB9ZXF2_CATRO|nr:hypothetical protein M9H77_30507 [Catharanthus roseus]